MFADDLMLMSITLRDLQKMINLCIEELTELDLTVNIKKTVCLRLGKNYDNESISSLVINNVPVTWKNELKYLGVTILAGKTFKINLQTIRHKFYKALNGVFGKIGTRASPAVLISLINSYCLPLLLYGIESLSVTEKIIKTLDNAYRSIFYKIFGANDDNSIKLCQFYCGVLPLRKIIDMRVFEFYKSVVRNVNECNLFLY